VTNGRVGPIVTMLSATVVLVACATAAPASNPPAATTAAPTSNPTPSLTETPAPTTAATAEVLAIPPITCCRGYALEPGRYEVPRWLDIPSTIDIPDGWRVLNEPPAKLFLLGRGRNVQDNPSQMILFLNVTGTGTPESIIDGIRDASELTEAAAPSATTVAGFPGLRVDMAAKPNPGFEGDPASDIPPGVQYLPVIEQYFARGFAWTTSSPEAQVRAVALTVGTQLLLLYLEAPSGELDAFASDAAAILDSLQLLS
jgi:hypothetical protein